MFNVYQLLRPVRQTINITHVIYDMKIILAQRQQYFLEVNSAIFSFLLESNLKYGIFSQRGNQ